jgi:dipeptidyl-peptidase-4
MRKISILLAFLISLLNYAQKKDITLEDIWTNGTFTPVGISGLVSMADGLHYTSLDENLRGELYITKYEYKTGKKSGVIVRAADLVSKGSSSHINIDSYSFSNDESKLLIATETEKIYRHSTRENYYVYDLKTFTLTKVSDGEKQMYASFSPDGSKVAFVRNNNIFVKDLSNGKEIAVTTDGKQNNIINGATDWVYEEEFAFEQAYQWSADGSKIAYYKFDESRVKEFEMNEYNANLYPTVYRFKYPKAGEENSIVTIHIYDFKQASTRPVDIGKETDQYIPRIKWTNDANTLSLLRMNRLQNKLELLFANASSGETKVILTEKSQTYIEVTDNLYFSNDNKSFTWSSDMDGFYHLYLYDMNGVIINQITKGNWDVLELNGIDESTKTVFYSSDETSVTERCLYSVYLDGSGKQKLSTGKGTNSVEFSSGFKYYINTFSDANTPPYITLHSADGKLIRVLEDNAQLKKDLSEYNLSKKEFFTFVTSENVELNAWIMKPVDFDPAKKYPVLLTFYGGPHNNEVSNEWGSSSYLWHCLLAQKGYLVACVDNRGTEGRGRDFKKCTYKQLGKLETQDQIEAAKFLGEWAYVDKTRIGVQGWSFGAYLSSLCMTKGANYFKTGIAVAPVTNWRFYDTIYTERYLSTPQDNPKGYDENSPINFAVLLKGKYLLIHGSADDNVHLQNTVEMSSALIKANKQFEQFIYPDKNHSIKGGSTRLHLYSKMTDFLLKNL